MTRKASKALMAIIGATILITASGWSTPAAAFEPFIGTIKYFAFTFPPRGWAFCNGQLQQISENNALFALIGTIYGGDGRTTFGLPDMRGRFPVHRGQGPGLSPRTIGQKSGQERVTLNANQIGHNHTLRGRTAAGNQSTPTGNSLAEDGTDTTYKNEAPNVQMHAGSITTASGGGQPHENMPPFLGVNCNIALFGLFPSRS